MTSIEKLNKYNIILGSASPRRQEILSGIGINFTIKKIECDETYPENLTGTEIPIYISKKKAEKFILSENDLLITADTIVWLENKVLGKPVNFQDAFNTLKYLSGKYHFVYTGVCIKTNTLEKTFSSETKVKFSEISDEDIKYYIENYKPFDKAGAYGIQEWIGKIAVEEISGSFYNVIGLPIHKLIDELISNF
ncbi:MAG: Maf family nucleotide pyrophosphatase [Bacteroidales bacterium]|jgi:septum formation protein|nr:Maf family nucleotide pyrophosphatase [Bacteroidales bacterium]